VNNGTTCTPESYVGPSGLTIRPATGSDLPQLTAIEKQCFPDPWPDRIFRNELENAASRNLMAVLPDGRAVGYCFWWDLGEEIEIHNLATHPEHRRRGVARALLGRVVGQATGSRKNRALLEVRKSNAEAIGLYTDMGFTRDSTRKAYYGDREDAVLMSLPLGPPDG
jgi:ribosomal-protein-alanine N-acetyltransferase